MFNNAPEYFDRLLLEVYKRTDVDGIYFVGDVNSKLGGFNTITIS